MPKKQSVKKVTKRGDFSSWNFIIFLTLAFILLVVVISQAKKTTIDLRAKAGLDCPEVTTPRAEDCPGGWTFKRNMEGCLAFSCEASKSATIE